MAKNRFSYIIIVLIVFPFLFDIHHCAAEQAGKLNSLPKISEYSSSWEIFSACDKMLRANQIVLFRINSIIEKLTKSKAEKSESDSLRKLVDSAKKGATQVLFLKTKLQTEEIRFVLGVIEELQEEIISLWKIHNEIMKLTNNYIGS